MILDTLENAPLYYACAPRLRQAFEFLAANDLALFPVGRHDIAGDEIFVNVMEGELKEPADAPLEVHNTYIDIQLLLVGDEEQMGWIPRADCCRPRGEFDAERDVRFYEDESQTRFALHRGQFVIFLPEDAHAPMIGRGWIKKAIVKVMK